MPKFTKQPPKPAAQPLAPGADLDATSRAAAARVSELRTQLEHAEANPLEWYDADYSKIVLDLRHDLAKAEIDAKLAATAVAQAEEAEEAARVKELVDGEGPRSDAADAALANVLAVAKAHRTPLAEAVALAVEAVAAKEQGCLDLRAIGLPIAKVAPLTLAKDWNALVDADPFVVASNVLAWEESAPRREGEQREADRLRDLDRKRHHDADALAGRLGPEARDAAEAEQRAELRRMYPGKGGGALGAGAVGSVAERELGILRQNAGLDRKE